MKKIKILAVTLLVASVAFMMTACGGGTPKNLEGTIWKGYYPGKKNEGVIVKFKSEGRAIAIDFEHEGKSNYEEDPELVKYVYNAPKGKVVGKDGTSTEFEIDGDIMTVYSKEVGPIELTRQD